MISLTLDTGLLLEEVTGLTLDSIPLERRRLAVISKSNKERHNDVQLDGSGSLKAVSVHSWH